MSYIDPALQLALKQFVTRAPLLIALDFDGTLAPLGIDPEASRMVPEARNALDALTKVPDVHIALVTGRSIDSIIQVATPDPSWFLVGSHGIEVVTPDQRAGYHTPDVVPVALSAGFDEIVANFPGSRKETKPFGVALHTRGLPDSVARPAEQAAHTFCEEWEGDIVVRTGHGIVECALEAGTKGDGIGALHTAVPVGATLFAGDDVTDEDGFAVLGATDVGIRVGGGQTRAAYRLEDVHAVAHTLWLVHELLTGMPQGSKV